MENKLPVEFKEKFLAALRSGDYKQGSLYLYNSETDCYCPIGVSTVICGVDKIFIDHVQFLLHEIFNPTEAGVPEILIGDVNSPLIKEITSMNDTGYSFNEIADFIEKNY